MSTGAQITIAMDDKGNVMVEGPLDNKVFCYGLLESARDVIHKYHAQREQPMIERPSSADVHSITARNGKRG